MTRFSRPLEQGSFGRKLGSIWRVTRNELGSLVLIGSGLLLFLARMGIQGGNHLLFYNADSLTMPLFSRGLHAIEGLRWSSGPFLGVFPELPTFLLAESVTTTLKSAIVVCGFLNSFFLYLAFRFLARCCGASPSVSRRSATLASVLVTLGMAAESFRGSSWMLGWSLFASTYYVGVTLFGVVTLALVCRILQNPAASSPALPPVVAVAPLFILAMVVTLSNPMFLVIVAAPMGAAILHVCITGRSTKISAIVSLVSLVTGCGLGYALQPLLNMVNVSSTGYIHPSRIRQTLDLLAVMTTSLLKDPFGFCEFFVLLSLIGLALWRTFSLVVRRCRSRGFADREQGGAGRIERKVEGFVQGEGLNAEFVAVFIGCWAILAPALLIITGSWATRYLGSAAAFPFCLVVSDYERTLHRFRSISRWVGLLVSVALVSAAGFFLSSAEAAVSITQPSEIACVSATLPRGASGVAEFWTARPIDLYNSNHLRVLQSQADLRILAWVSNPAEFNNRDLTFVLTSWVDHDLAITPDSLRPLGKPSRITKCGQLDVYEYWPGTPAHAALNQRFVYSER
jgi:hypothetical protein